MNDDCLVEIKSSDSMISEFDEIGIIQAAYEESTL